MNLSALVVTCCLLGQTTAGGDEPPIEAPKPQFVPKRAPRVIPRDDAGKKQGSPSRTTPPADAPTAAEPEPSIYDGPLGDPRTGNARQSDPAAPATDDSSDATGTAEESQAPASTEEDTEALVDVQAPAPKMRPPEILAEALTPPKQEPIEGKAWRLIDLLSRVPDRQQQIKAVQAYWDLAAAQAGYYFALDAQQRLINATDTQTAQPAVESALAAARADKLDAEQEVIRAQHALAQEISLLSSDPLPLAVDRPHVGDYRTHYETIFSGRSAPANLQLIQRTLPIRRKAIDVHAAAIVAANDAVDATAEDFQTGSADLMALLETLDTLARQRRAFLSAVRLYNHNIAEYGLSVAPLPVGPTVLETVLIRKNNAAANGSNSRGTSRTPAESGTQPGASADNGASGDFGPTNRTFDDDAAPADARSPADTEPPAATGNEPTPADQPSGTPGEPTPADPAEEPAATADEPTPASTSDADARLPQRRTSNRLQDADLQAGSSALYQALLGESPPLRTQKLAGLLHWNRTAPPESGEPTALAAVLGRSYGTARGDLIAHYWRTRERAARYQVQADRAELLTGLMPAALAVRDQPGGPTAMLRLQTARYAAEADKLDEQALLLESQFQLTRAAGSPLERPWLFPSTAPHAGRYNLKPVEAQQPSRARAAAALVPLQQAELQERSAAVIFVDTHRAQLAGQAEATPGRLSAALAALDEQVGQTLSFLGTQTDYNLAIADYVLAMFPNQVSSEQLVGMLVVADSSDDE